MQTFPLDDEGAPQWRVFLVARAAYGCVSRCHVQAITKYNQCKVEPGQKACSQCRQTSTECNFDARDGRKNRANSKAVANELSQRIQQLESLLKDTGHGHAAVEASSQLDLQHEQHPHSIETDSESQSTPCYDDEPPPYPEAAVSSHAYQTSDAAAHSKAIVGKLAPRPVKFDMASGRVRFFGPTTNMHILTRSTIDAGRTSETFWPISALVRDLSPATHDYLIDLFFDCHNSAMHIVHKWAFLDDLKEGGTQWYSNFLHMCLLAEGYRYADKSRADIKKLACPGPESSTFHTKAKKMVELELVKPGGVPSIQALFLLGDLEVGIGRDDTGWMFAGMAFRLLFDVGLHVDPSELRLTEREVQIRHMVLWACILNDVYWALYLGRPTMLKASDMAPACLNKDFDRLIESQTRTYAYEKTIETRIYEALLQLMDLLEPLCETRDLRKNLKPSDAYLNIATLDRRLNNWYADLPERLRWTPANVKTAPASFYLLHSQYHTALILLHRTFPTQPPQNVTRHSGSTHFSTLSRNVCISNAEQVAEIISQYRRRFDIRRIFVTGLQHVGTAATALMAEISTLQGETQTEAQTEKDAGERGRLLGYLDGLRGALREMSNMYQPAVLMASVIGHFIRDSGVPEKEDGAQDTGILVDASLAAERGKHLLPVSAPDLARATGANTLAPFEGASSSMFSQASSSSSSGFLHPSSASGSQSQINTRAPATPTFGFQNGGGTSNGGFDGGGGLPFLPSSWFEEMNWEEDTEFLNLMGLKDLQSKGLMDVDGFELLGGEACGSGSAAGGGGGLFGG
ncbi:fungal-specific transcription factor domain-domain-containing protein [Clohesyomyces aquaticus]|uniref:Fungal-specific transcription factor domain-domain-containing protein n=1 Tax=Clohesyomyces aquaticus TaxID=1231657 RepID=A0A1Y2A6N6_9PLEO|nr:fungal-specific transcription factor domain-domain-containing protein [Clohesyomyces aquaticus]